MKRAHINRKCSLPLIFVSISALILIFISILSHLKPNHSSFPTSISVDSDSSDLPELPRFAYFISGTSGDGERLRRLLQASYHPRNYYLLHLDLEASDSERLELAKYVKSAAVIRSFKNVMVMGKGDLVTPKGPTAMASTLHAIAVLLKQPKRWDWFVNLGASDYPLMPQDDLLHIFSYLPRDLNFLEHTSDFGWKEYQRTRPIIIDPGLYHSKKSGVFWAKEKRSLPASFKLFTVLSCARLPIASCCAIVVVLLHHCVQVIIDEGSRPQFLHKDIVTKWKEYWATPEFQVKSQQASKNRRSEPAGPGTGLSIHYGGSRSAISHAEHVAREKNISIADAHYDTFMRMHFKKGQFDGRAQTQGLEIHSRVEELRSTLGRDVTPDEVSQIYREVVTPDPKGRRLGLGIMSQMRSTGSTSTHSTCSSQFPSAAVSAQIAQLQTELEQTQQREATLQATLQAEVQERRRKEAEMEAEVQERRRKEAEMETRQLEMQQQISQLMKFFQSSSRSSSPP